MKSASRYLGRWIKRNDLQLIFLASLILIALPALLPAYRSNLSEASIAGEFGDLVGGFFGPVLSLIGIFFVVKTLREQRSTTSAERVADEIESFENRYYELLRIHRANVAELSIGKDLQGGRVFVAILSELKAALKVVETIDTKITFADQLQLAYYCVFFGVGVNSSVPLSEAVRATDTQISKDDLLALEGKLDLSRHRFQPYFYFDGHQSRLAHYYRHLFQFVTFVEGQELGINKQSYMKTIRAQLSNHEQALLLINSLSGIGWDWWNQDLLLKYGLVKNIPAGFMERYCNLSVKELFPDGYFEWQQVAHKPSILANLRRSDEV